MLEMLLFKKKRGATATAGRTKAFQSALPGGTTSGRPRVVDKVIEGSAPPRTLLLLCARATTSARLRAAQALNVRDSGPWSLKVCLDLRGPTYQV